MRHWPRPSTSWRALTVAGAAGAVLVAVTGRALEQRRFGGDESAIVARVEREVTGTIDARAQGLRAMANRVKAAADLAALVASGREAAGPLDEAVRRGDAPGADDRALTVYGSDGRALAWIGRPSTLPADRLAGPPALFAAPGPLGLRLVHVEPIVLNDPARGVARRVGVLAAEHALSPAESTPAPAGYTLDTGLGRVALRLGEGGSRATGTIGFTVRAPSGEPLIEVDVSGAEVAAAQSRWRERVRGLTFGLLGITLLVAASPLFEWRRRTDRPARYLLATGGLIAAVAVARVVAWSSVPTWWRINPTLVPSPESAVLLRLIQRSAIDLFLTAIALAAVVALLADAVLRARAGSRTWRRDAAASWTQLAWFAGCQAAAGTTAVVLLIGVEILLGATVEQGGFDILHLALHPWDVHRLSVVAGLLAFHAATVWAVVIVLVTASIPWRVSRRSPRVALLMLAGWVLPGIVIVAATPAAAADVPRSSLWLVLGVSAAAAWVGRRGLGWFRHGAQTLRLGALLLAVVVPSLLLYPSLAFFSDRQQRHLVETQFAVQAMNHPAELQTRLEESLDQIDREPALADRISAIGGGSPQTDAAFLVWQQTALAANRLTSAVELYDASGVLVSRFALSFPEYASRTPRYSAASCDWEVFGEAAPFGAEERRMLHAERGVCDAGGRLAGTIVVHVMPDYNVLPFISSQNPYIELFRGASRAEGRAGVDVGLVIYGWGRTVMYNSTRRAWILDDELFGRIYRSRVPFWATLEGSDRRHRVFFANDRFAIYAVDYPAPGVFDHFVHLAEIATLSALAFVGLVVAGGFARRIVWTDTRPGRRLLREFRTSFYRKLFLAFVAASVVPVLILAFLVRAYVAGRLRADVEAEAARTVAVAQRVIEETLAAQPHHDPGGATIDDDLTIWVSRVLGQDVNVFAGPQVVATSERDLFASGLLPTRVPDAVYRALVLQQLPSFVGEDRIGQFRYLMAAAPIRAAGHDTLITVPLASRQREIEREIDDLDRGVQLGAIVFILLGAGIGFWMAERIGDPVQRLTRASRRIAAGDLDARVFVRSADEFQRLVESFNSMAFELKRQRTRLERTNRLEAWAEMARQVAHDIKNPLTPIQLSAEHLRRVHQDQGGPLGSVLDNCVDAILAQVRLLRQIAGEFSSFASTPSPRPVPTDIRDLLDEVGRAYAPGLADRIRLTVDVAADVPSITVDRAILGRAVTNVIENALHAMPGDGSLALVVTREPEAVAIAITDTGGGMDEESLARIFEPYFSTKATGTGLGLTIARRNVELHGGTVRVESRKGLGTTVTLRIPVNGGGAS
jgi:signal transduction histidine kinase